MRRFSHIASVRLEKDACYQAVVSRDARFDGLFFIAVSSTKIYCRTVCRVKTPLKKNCTFYTTAAEAESAGYRPCLRCRPELAPGNSAMEAVSRLATLAMQQIEAGALNGASIADLADEFGVTDRHLRRVLADEIGVSPVEIAQTRRLLFAKQLLTDTAMPVTDIAYASGFGSVRRFNTIFKNRYRLAPRQFRKAEGKNENKESIRCELAYRPPLDWPALLEFLKLRAVQGVELIEGDCYRRSVRLGLCSGHVSVKSIPGKNALHTEISATLLPVLPQLLMRLRRLFDLNAEPMAIALHLGNLAEKNPGLRLPGAFDGFEIAVRAILGQQITVKAATTLAARFSAKFGEPLDTGVGGLTHLTPAAEKIATLQAGEIAGLGIIAKRAESIIALAGAVAEKRISLEPAPDVAGQIAALIELPGIGNWTAHYIAMRCLGWPDAFLESDLVVLKVMGEKKPQKVAAIAEKWRPWRSYAVIHLWNKEKT